MYEDDDMAAAIANDAIVTADFEEAVRLVNAAKAAYDGGQYRRAASDLGAAVDGALTPLRLHVEDTWRERTALMAIEAAGLSDE